MMQQPNVPAKIQPRLVGDLLAASVARYGARPAMDFLGRRWTYAALGALVDRATRGLQDLGVAPGVMVGLCLPNTPYYPIFYYAVLQAGGTVVNFNPLYVERELSHQIGDSGTRIMVVLDLEAVYRRVANVADSAGLKHVIVCPMAGILPPAKSALFRAFKRGDRARIPADARHIRFAAIVASRTPATPSPSTRRPPSPCCNIPAAPPACPKGAMLTHANLTANCAAVARALAQRPLGTGTRAGRAAVLPRLRHDRGAELQRPVGAEIVMLPRFELQQTLAAIAAPAHHRLPRGADHLHRHERGSRHAQAGTGLDPVRRVGRRAAARRGADAFIALTGCRWWRATA